MCPVSFTDGTRGNEESRPGVRSLAAAFDAEEGRTKDGDRAADLRFIAVGLPRLLGERVDAGRRGWDSIDRPAVFWSSRRMERLWACSTLVASRSTMVRFEGDDGFEEPAEVRMGDMAIGVLEKEDMETSRGGGENPP